MSEVVALTLDDIDWRTGSIRIPQRQTGTALVLPLTDAALRFDHVWERVGHGGALQHPDGRPCAQE